MRLWSWLLGLVAKVCAFVFALGLAGLAIGAANELFSLGIFDNDYPVIDFDGGPEGTSRTEPGTWGEYFRQTGLITLICGVVGFVTFTASDLTEEDFES